MILKTLKITAAVTEAGAKWTGAAEAQGGKSCVKVLAVREGVI